MKGSRELPTSRQTPDPKVPRSRFQNVRESGVLATLIERSRHQWLMEGVFERYWTKPSKKKHQPEGYNPAKESMARLGSCSMIIEPHAFEVTMYTIKDNQFPILLPTNQPYNGTSSGTPNTLLPLLTSPEVQTQYQAPTLPNKPLSQPVLPPFREGFAHFDTQGLSPGVPGHFATSSRIAAVPASGKSVASNGGSNGNLDTAPREPITNSDPVIQMLAARAATDHDLKSLMKVVAQGNASTEQLKVFQKHIDDLNNIIEAQDNRPENNIVPRANTADAASRAPVSALSAANQPRPTPTPFTPAHSSDVPSMLQIKTEPLFQYSSQQPQYPKTNPPFTLAPDASAIVFDFTAGNGDRYFLPKYSILEYLPGNTQVLMSFLITRKGSTVTSERYKNNVEYYQPVTIRLSTHNSRILEPLSRSVAPVEEVRRYMAEVMSKMTAAEEVHLEPQLPLAPNAISMELEEGTSHPPDVLSSQYSPPNSLLPMYIATKVSQSGK
ncbi:hypothetical protein MMC13_000644 [Lambiella insularis]|nr:hypothetical protein [Lambiella insularis]